VLVNHAQRVAEGVHLEVHRNTWRYSVVIEEQRLALAERRERLLTSEVAAIMLLERTEKAKEIDEDVLSEAARSIAIYHLDRLWAEHLAELSEVREGVHLATPVFDGAKEVDIKGSIDASLAREAKEFLRSKNIAASQVKYINNSK